MNIQCIFSFTYIKKKLHGKHLRSNLFIYLFCDFLFFTLHWWVAHSVVLMENQVSQTINYQAHSIECWGSILTFVFINLREGSFQSYWCQIMSHKPSTGLIYFLTMNEFWFHPYILNHFLISLYFGWHNLNLLT